MHDIVSRIVRDGPRYLISILPFVATGTWLGATQYYRLFLTKCLHFEIV